MDHLVFQEGKGRREWGGDRAILPGLYSGEWQSQDPTQVSVLAKSHGHLSSVLQASAGKGSCQEGSHIVVSLGDLRNIQQVSSGCSTLVTCPLPDLVPEMTTLPSPHLPTWKNFSSSVISPVSACEAK